jgi:hypothetical protein
MRGFDRLDDFEPFEFRVAECERLEAVKKAAKALNRQCPEDVIARLIRRFSQSFHSCPQSFYP